MTTDATTAGTGQEAPPAPAPTTQAPQDAPPTAPATLLGQDAPPALDGPEPDAQQADKSADKPAGAPEKYEFQPPEGQQFDDKVLGAYSDAARELNLSQEAAQQMLDRLGPAIRDRQLERAAEAATHWREQAGADKEFGGVKLTENLAVAARALQQFGTPELKTLLNESGLGNHPEVIRAFYRAGKAISEDRFVGSGGTAPQSGGDARSFYPNSNLT